MKPIQLATELLSKYNKTDTITEEYTKTFIYAYQCLVSNQSLEFMHEHKRNPHKNFDYVILALYELMINSFLPPKVMMFSNANIGLFYNINGKIVTFDIGDDATIIITNVNNMTYCVWDYVYCELPPDVTLFIKNSLS